MPKLICTDFDGTLNLEHELPPVPDALQDAIEARQGKGDRWMINTGRDMASLLEELARSHWRIMPDYLGVVERELYENQNGHFVPLEPWNRNCTNAHREMFGRVEHCVPELFEWVNASFRAMTFADEYSPFCVVAANNDDMDAIEGRMNEFCRGDSHLNLVRNDVYARFCHEDYTKGTGMAEVARRIGIERDDIMSAGDHLNDLTMLSDELAGWLVAPVNAVEAVKDRVRESGGWVSAFAGGHGVLDGLREWLRGETE